MTSYFYSEYSWSLEQRRGRDFNKEKNIFNGVENTRFANHKLCTENNDVTNHILNIKVGLWVLPHHNGFTWPCTCSNCDRAVPHEMK